VVERLGRTLANLALVLDEARVSPATMGRLRQVDQFCSQWSRTADLYSRRLRGARHSGSAIACQRAAALLAAPERAPIGLSPKLVPYLDEGRLPPVLRPLPAAVEGSPLAARLALGEQLAWSLLAKNEVSGMDEVHRACAFFAPEFDDGAGRYRRGPAATGTPLERVCAGADGRDPASIPSAAAHIVATADESLRTGRHHPILVALFGYLSVLVLAPFEQANDSVGRVLLRQWLLRGGCAFLLAKPIEVALYDERLAIEQAARATLQSYAAGGDWAERWARPLVACIVATVARVERSSIWRSVRLLHTPTSALILDLVRRAGQVTMTLALAELGLPRGSLAYHLRCLVRDGKLLMIGAGPSTHYVLALQPQHDGTIETARFRPRRPRWSTRPRTLD